MSMLGRVPVPTQWVNERLTTGRFRHCSLSGLMITPLKPFARKCNALSFLMWSKLLKAVGVSGGPREFGKRFSRKLARFL